MAETVATQWDEWQTEERARLQQLGGGEGYSVLVRERATESQRREQSSRMQLVDWDEVGGCCDDCRHRINDHDSDASWKHNRRD